MKTIQEILKIHKAYTPELELDLLRNKQVAISGIQKAMTEYVTREDKKLKGTKDE